MKMWQKFLPQNVAQPTLQLRFAALAAHAAVASAAAAAAATVAGCGRKSKFAALQLPVSCLLA